MKQIVFLQTISRSREWTKVAFGGLVHAAKAIAQPRAVWLALACLLLSGVVHAHHSFVSEYTEDRGEVTGTIQQVAFSNPHARFYLDVTTSEGEPEQWEIQTQSVNTLIRYGITKETFAPGQTVTVKGYLGRNNANKIYLQEMITEQGEVIRPNPSQQDTGGYQEIF